VRGQDKVPEESEGDAGNDIKYKYKSKNSMKGSYQNGQIVKKYDKIQNPYSKNSLFVFNDSNVIRKLIFKILEWK
jgi:hypothetical protein